MGQVIDKPATYADIEALPANVVGEILYGRLVTHPRPSRPHVHASSMLGFELIGPFVKGLNGPGGWHIYDEPELHSRGHVAVPDMAGWRKERLPDDFDAARFTVVPDWACEFLSPSIRRYDKGGKRAVYAEIGVLHLWYVDPIARMLEVFSLKDREWIASHTFFEDDQVVAPPFEEATIPLASLWHDMIPEKSETPSATN